MRVEPSPKGLKAAFRSFRRLVRQYVWFAPWTALVVAAVVLSGGVFAIEGRGLTGAILLVLGGIVAFLGGLWIPPGTPRADARKLLRVLDEGFENAAQLQALRTEKMIEFDEKLRRARVRGRVGVGVQPTLTTVLDQPRSAAELETRTVAEMQRSREIRLEGSELSPASQEERYFRELVAERNQLLEAYGSEIAKVVDTMAARVGRAEPHQSALRTRHAQFVTVLNSYSHAISAYYEAASGDDQDAARTIAANVFEQSENVTRERAVWLATARDGLSRRGTRQAV